MRILLVGDYPNDPRLGSTKVLDKLRQEFVRLGHECDLLLSDAIGPHPRRRPLREAAGPFLAARAIRLTGARRGPYDVVDIASGEGALFGLARRLGRSRRPAFVSRSNGLEHLNYRRMLEDHREGLLHKPWTRRLWYPAMRLPQVALAARLADRLLVLNDGDRRFAERRGWKPAGRIDVVPHGVADEFLEPLDATAARGAGALFCGSWSDVKGVPYLVKSWSQVVGQRAANLTVLGGGVDAATIAAAFEPAARPHVTVIDRVGEAEVRRQYRRHDLLVFPSTYEGFGMVVIEAMSQGLPVVATPVGCVPSVVDDEATGLLVPPRDPNRLAAALLRLLGEGALRARLGAAARARVAGMSWTRTAERTLEVYRRAQAG